MSQYQYNNNKQNMKNNKDITKYKITMLGNTGVGKSTFLSNISTKKLKHQNSFNINDIMIDLHVLGKDYKIHLIQLAAKSVDIHKQQNITNICNNSNLILIFFDISNKQSFLQIGRKWLKLIQTQLNNVQHIILIANKIDKQGMQLKNLFQYANSLGVQLFFMNQDMDCKKILGNIVLAHQYKVQCQRLRKLNMQQPKKQQGFFKKIFGSNSQSVQQKQSKAQVKKLQQNYLRRLYQIKKSFHNAENKIQNEIKQFENNIKNKIRQIISFFNIQIVKKQNNQMEVLFQCIKNKIKQLQKTKQQQRQMHLKAQSKCIQLNDQIKNMKKQLYKRQQQLYRKQKQQQQLKQMLNKKQKQQQQLKQILNKKQKQQQQLKQILNKKQKQNKILHQKYAAILQLYNKQKQQNKKLKQQTILRVQKLQQKDKQMQKLQKKHEQLNRSHMCSTIGQSQLSKQNQQYKQQINVLQQTINQICNREIFWEVSAFRNMSIQLIKQFSSNISQVQKNKQIKKCQKIYQHDLCSFVDFRYYLHYKSNLLYVIELENNAIIVYAAESYQDMTAGKIGCFMAWNKTDVMRKLKIKENGDIWRYNPVNLVYGNRQIYVKFRKNKCILQLIDKNKTIFTQKYQHIAQLLQLPQNNNLQYEIKSLQIFKLDFKSL